MIKFSILVPSIPSRVTKYLMPLYEKLELQAKDKPVEILALLDNKKRSIGLKRDSLVQQSRGEYVAFVDDDDEVSDDYVDSILSAIELGSDVVTFEQVTTINGGNPFKVSFGLSNENEAANFDVNNVWQDIKRKPFHVCVWKGDLARKYRFPDASYGEDWYWAEQVLADVKTETHINKVLHYYRYDDRVTEAELTFPPKKEDSNVLAE